MKAGKDDMRFLLISVLFLVCLCGGARADLETVRASLDSNRDEIALQQLAVDPERETGEGLHLAAIAKARIAIKRAIDADEQGWSESERQEIKSLLERSSQLRYAPAMVDLAVLLGSDSEQMPAQSSELLIDAAEIGDQLSVSILFGLYCSGESVPGLNGQSLLNQAYGEVYAGDGDQPKARRRSIFSAQVDERVIESSIAATYAQSLVTGGCFAANPAEGRDLFDRLLQSGGAGVAVAGRISDMVMTFEGSVVADPTRLPVAKDERRAVDWLIYLSDHDIAYAHNYADLAGYLVEGSVVPRDLSRATREVENCFRKGQEDGFNWCMTFSLQERLMELLKSTNSGPEFRAADKLMMLILSNSKSSYGYYRLAEFFRQHTENEAAMQRALELYKAAAELGDSDAAFDAGYMLAVGDGVPKDAVAARRYFEQAADDGGYVAQYNLGLLYRQGQGGEVDLVKSAQYTRMAAEAGYADAEAEYGRMIGAGEGVLENDQLAILWLTKAAQKNQKYAQYNLAVHYSNGEGVSQDYVEAYKWANLSAAQGYTPAAELKERLSKYMSRDQVARAQQLSANWKPGFSNSSDADPRSSGDRTRTQGPNKELILSVQSSLADLGYYRDSVDGVAGPKTRQAIVAFQEDFGLATTGEASAELAVELGKALAQGRDQMPRSKREPSSVSATGTAFLVSMDGSLVTNAHVIQGCKKLTLPNGQLLTMQAFDPASDLALLRSSDLAGRPALPLRSGRGIRLADEVMVAGFPLTGIVSPDVNITVGNISSLTGPDGDRGLIQMTAPVQVGNSGGPIVDNSGHVIGVVVSKLDAIQVAALTGDIPQNVNFGISLGTLQSFLDANAVEYEMRSSGQAEENAVTATKLQKATFQVQCF